MILHWKVAKFPTPSSFMWQHFSHGVMTFLREERRAQEGGKVGVHTTVRQWQQLLKNFYVE